MKKIFSVSDFIAFGERYGIDYRFLRYRSIRRVVPYFMAISKR